MMEKNNNLFEKWKIAWKFLKILYANNKTFRELYMYWNFKIKP